MMYETLLFLAGIGTFSLFKTLPGLFWVGTLIITGFVIYPIKLPGKKHLVSFIAGLAYVIGYAHLINHWQLPGSDEGKTLLARGTIISLPITTTMGKKFLFKLTSLNQHPCRASVHLTWKTQNSIHVGEIWALNLRLKRIHGIRNPGSFDYEAFAYQEGIRATGYVLPNAKAIRLANHWYSQPINRVREIVKDKLLALLPKTHTALWLTALLIGERECATSNDWEILRSTGTNHLMAIAGLHIGMMAMLMYGLVKRIWCQFPWLILLIPAQFAGAIASLLMTLCYSLLAGFSLPAERASLMVGCYVMFLLLKRQQPARQALGLALLLVLLHNPLTILTESFWLSFGAVAFILFGVSGRMQPTGWWWRIGRVQWVITLGLMPLGLWLFHEISFIALLANSVPIPLVPYLIVPGCFIGLFVSIFSKAMASHIFYYVDLLMKVLWCLLDWFAHRPHVLWYASPSWLGLVFCLLGVIIILLPKGVPGRYLGIVLMAPSLLTMPQQPTPNSVWLTQLDVGQGLATVVQTAQHTLIFDAGAKFNDNSDMGNTVVLPFLQQAGIKTIDTLIISHGDNDHIGGAQALINHMPMNNLLSSVPNQLPQGKLCQAGMQWQWDGVKFAILSPRENLLGLNNNSSCVVKISVATHAILLTGDIEKFAEQQLLINQANNLSADILIAPHHGSKTSSLPAFIQAVAPQYVLLSYGYHNRYHFPHTEAIKHYEHCQATLLNTVDGGALQLHLDPSGVTFLNQYRKQALHAWSF